MDTPLTREQLATLYLEQLQYEPYAIQEEALLAWFTTDQGVLVCAPTGTGKTLIAEAAVFEALHSNQQAYYTTPLIALTDQKFQELREAAVRWGFSVDDVGLVTGNRRVNPDAPILVVVAEILLNRLLHGDSFSFADTASVVMDEFHSFNDAERGIVWEMTLGLLPARTRLLLLSATVGNAREFVFWLSRCHQRRLELVEGTERRVPLTFQWVGDALLSDHLEWMYSGGGGEPFTPALIFTFNRQACWDLAEQFKGKKLIDDKRKKELSLRLAELDFTQGAGPKLKQLLLRGVGVHHAGLLPKYRRIVERLFQEKLLSVAVCTETLAAGVNLPARSVVLPTLLKGPPGKKRLLDASSAHQMFGRAGRPQFDDQGFVFVLAHEDDVKVLRWQEKYDQIPEDTKDPGLLKARKALKKKQPKRRTTEQYWTEAQFDQLRFASPARLSSRGPLPWRLLAFMLEASPEIELIRRLVGKRLLTPKQLETGQIDLQRRLLTLWRSGYVTLEPNPPLDEESLREYRSEFAHPTSAMAELLLLRSVDPLYGVFLGKHLGAASEQERILAMESVLEMPASVLRYVRPPGPHEMPPGPLAQERLDPHLVQLGLATAEQLHGGSPSEDEGGRREWTEEPPPRPLALAEKLYLLFTHDFPDVPEIVVSSVWAVGEIMEFEGNFDSYVRSKRLQTQEGVLFRHMLRFILLAKEFSTLSPADGDADLWREEMLRLASRLTECCRRVDPESTDDVLRTQPCDTPEAGIGL